MKVSKFVIISSLTMIVGCGAALENRRGKTLAPRADHAESVTPKGLRLSTPEGFETKEYDEELWEELAEEYRTKREVIASCGTESLPVLRVNERHIHEIWEEQGEGTLWSLTLKVYSKNYYKIVELFGMANKVRKHA